MPSNLSDWSAEDAGPSRFRPGTGYGEAAMPPIAPTQHGRSGHDGSPAGPVLSIAEPDLDEDAGSWPDQHDDDGPRSRPRPKKPARRPGTGAGGRLRSRRAGQARSGQDRRSAGRIRPVARLPLWMKLVSCSAVVVVLAVAAYLRFASQPAHVVSAPAKLGGYVTDPALAQASHAQQLRAQIVAGAAGEVKNVVDAVYEKSTGSGTSTGPQIIVFIGGNLTGGGSAGSFISGFMTQLHRSFTTSAGVLGGQAACAPGSNGRPAECAWADNDTFGVIVSPTLSAAGLASEMRQMRPLVEHVAR
jgi:hypothetical protein